MSVESFVISELVSEATPKKAFAAGIGADDFDECDEEFQWIVERAERKLPINPRVFKKKFPEFDFVRPDERLTDLLEEFKRERAFIAISAAIDEILGGEQPIDTENALDKAIQLRETLSDVVHSHAPQSEIPIKATWRDHVIHLRNLQTLYETGVTPGIPTGFKNLDHHFGGYQGGCTYIYLGRPGDAKSFVLAKNAVEAEWSGYNVGLFSPEMTEHQHRCRIATLRSAIPAIQKELGLRGAFRNRALKDGHGFNLKSYSRFAKWYEENVKGEIHLFTQKYRREKMGTAFIESRVDDLGLDLIIVDPIYKLKSPRRRGTRWEELGEITDSLTHLAQSFDIPVVLSNQANRALVGKRGDAPDKDSSFGSDAPIQEADAVVGVRHFSDERIIRVNCSKNRHGETFKFTVGCNLNIGRLEDITPVKNDYTNGYDPEKVEELRDAMKETEE